MIYRKAEKDLQNWFTRSNRKPLVLRGARQVGKSTLVREFARKNNLDLMEINLERYQFLENKFKNLNTDDIIKELEAITEKSISDSSLIFLDEIQEVPSAIQSLRYFYEDKPHIPVIAAGSLLEFSLADHNFSMPVGRIEYYHLGPLSFKEFINAHIPDYNKYFEKIDFSSALPEIVHLTLQKKYKEFLILGGMPEAVDIFCKEGLNESIRVHKSIINTYYDDFSKYAKKGELLLLQRIFSSIPNLIVKKVKYSNISREHKSLEIKNAISLLLKARILIPVYHSHCNGIPLNSEADQKNFKLLFMDVGLVNSIAGIDWLSISNLDEIKLINEGITAEQFVGQHLAYLFESPSFPQLNYWIREGRKGNAEIDYVVSIGEHIVPVEVKSGTSGSLKSLQLFMNQKKLPLAVRFDLNQCTLLNSKHTISTPEGNKKVNFNLLSIPIYAVEELPRLVDKIRQDSMV